MALGLVLGSEKKKKNKTKQKKKNKQHHIEDEYECAF